VAGALTLDSARIAAAIAALAAWPVDRTALMPAIDPSLREIARGVLPGPSWMTDLLDRASGRGVRFGGGLLLFRKVLVTLRGVVADVCPQCSIDHLLMSAALESFGREWPARLVEPPFSRRLGTHLSNADLMGMIAAAPLAAIRWWTGSFTGPPHAAHFQPER